MCLCSCSDYVQYVTGLRTRARRCIIQLHVSAHDACASCGYVALRDGIKCRYTVFRVVEAISGWRWEEGGVGGGLQGGKGGGVGLWTLSAELRYSCTHFFLSSPPRPLPRSSGAKTPRGPWDPAWIQALASRLISTRNPHTSTPPHTLFFSPLPPLDEK